MNEFSSQIPMNRLRKVSGYVPSCVQGKAFESQKSTSFSAVNTNLSTVSNVQKLMFKSFRRSKKIPQNRFITRFGQVKPNCLIEIFLNL